MSQRQTLERQADSIEAVLSLHRIPARVTGGTVTPRWVRFQVLPGPGASISKIKGLSEELAAALGVPECRVARRGAAVAIEVPRDDPQPVRLLPLYNQLVGEGWTGKPGDRPPVKFPATTAVLGLAEDGAPLLIRLPSPDVGHILIAGDAGAGKTMLLQSIVLSLAMTNSPDDLAFIFLGDGLAEAAQAIHRVGFPVHRIASMGAAIIKSAVRAAGKRVVFVADEVVGSNGCASALGKQLAMTDMHHYILAWEGVPPKEIVDLFNVRLVGQGEAGDFLAEFGGGRMRFQAAHVSPEEILGITGGATQ